MLDNFHAVIVNRMRSSGLNTTKTSITAAYISSVPAKVDSVSTRSQIPRTTDEKKLMVLNKANQRFLFLITGHVDLFDKQYPHRALHRFSLEHRKLYNLELYWRSH